MPSPDPLRLSVPKAYVVLTAEAVPDAATARAILDYVRGWVSPFKRIRRVDLRLRESERVAGGSRGEREFWEEDFVEDARHGPGAAG